MAELRFGIVGLGAGSRLVLGDANKVPGVRLTAGADIREEARMRFSREHGLPTFASVEALCASGTVDAVWIETPNHLHCAHTVAAAERGLHVICAKPLAATLEECERMIAACRMAGVQLLLGHSKIFDSPVRAIAEVARGGRLGSVIGIDSWWFNDWLRRPRSPEELDESLGAGFILRQAPHLVDIACHIVGERAVCVRAMGGSEKGHCRAMITFEGGAVASFTLDGNGYFASSELTWDIGIFGDQRAPAKPAALSGPLGVLEKYGMGSERDVKTGAFKPFVGLTIVSCERGVMRQSPDGLYLYTDESREEIAVPAHAGRAAELIELRDAVAQGRGVFPDGAWGKANLALCLGILRSARENREIEVGA